MSTPYDDAQTVKRLALEQGFDLVGIARPAPTSHPDAFRQWIASGKHGAMEYLARNIDDRLDLTRRFPWAKSIVCVGLAYFQNPPPSLVEDAYGRIARYAWGRDYHKVIETKLRQLEQGVRAIFEVPASGESLQVRTYCDTGPLLERELAARAGIGWIGKHTLLIHPGHGSWFLLGEMLLSLELEPDAPMEDHCGTCRRCIEACPTDAIAPYEVDATKCISYQTLENRGVVDTALHPAMREAGFVLGCDICQEVCPHNGRPLHTSETEFAVRMPAPTVGLQDILNWQEQEWDILTRGRALRRAKFGMWQRNARILKGGDTPGLKTGIL